MQLRGGRARDVVKALGPVAAASIPFYMPIVALLAVAYTQLSPWTLALFVIPAVAAQRLLQKFPVKIELET